MSGVIRGTLDAWVAQIDSDLSACATGANVHRINNIRQRLTYIREFSKSNEMTETAHDCMAELARNLGHLLADIALSLKDKRITDDEMRKIDQDWERIISVFQSMHSILRSL